MIEDRKKPDRATATPRAASTRSKQYEFLSGRVEVRAKLPDPQRHMAARLDTSRPPLPQVGSPACTRSTSSRTSTSTLYHIHSSVHTTAYNQHDRRAETTIVTVAKPVGREPSTSTPSRGTTAHIDVFVNRQKYFTFRKTRTRAQAGCQRLDRPRYLLINLAIGG